VGLWVFIARRIVLAFFVLIVVSVATFLLAHAVPGDPIEAILGDRQSDNPEVRAALERR
jgi:ABC-type dipeptide/oligopeptide/nickel transport system permease component